MPQVTPKWMSHLRHINLNTSGTQLEKTSPLILELQKQAQLPVAQNSILLDNLHDQVLCKKLSTITENSYEGSYIWATRRWNHPSREQHLTIRLAIICLLNSFLEFICCENYNILHQTHIVWTLYSICVCVVSCNTFVTDKYSLI